MAGCADVEYKGPRPAPIGPVDGVSQSDQDQNNRSAFNDDLYCDGDSYVPLPNNEFQCEDRDTHKTKKPTPKVTVPKVTTPAKPAVPATPAKPAVPAAPKPAAPKPAAPAPYKAPAPAPYKAPAKTGK